MPNAVCQSLTNLLGEVACREWIEWLELRGFQHMGGDYPHSYRSNDRLILDDPELALRLFEALRPALPEVLHRTGRRWLLRGLNSRFRACRYHSGQAFSRHRDGAHSDGPTRQSLLTLMLYLNDGSEFVGGRTRFYNSRWAPDAELCVTPRAGLGILFDHSLWHDGEAVAGGRKYVLRTDVMYESLETSADAHSGYVFDLAELSDGRLASASRDQTVRIWSQGTVKAVLRHHRGSVTRLCAVGHQLWSGGRDRQIAIWGGDLTLQTHFQAHQGAILDLLPVNDGRVVSSGADGCLCWWDPQGRLQGREPCGRWPWGLCQLSSGELLAGDDQGNILAVAPGCGAKLRFQAACGVQCVAEGAGLVMAGGSDGCIYRWHPDGQPLSVWMGHQGPVTSLIRLPDGRMLSGSEDDGVRIWEADGTSQELLRHQDFVRALCLVEGGTRLASGSYDGSVRLTSLPSPSNPRVMACSERAAKPGGARSGTAAASW
ncbi:2OG-Fe(II) oxygenase [bacterium]|nr:2OG-Fe(II) oxygenase [bacterium]